MTKEKCRTCKYAFTIGKDRWYCKKSLADNYDCGKYETARIDNNITFKQYCLSDNIATKELLNALYGTRFLGKFKGGYHVYPKKVIFNKPATVVIWNDGLKTVVKCQKGDRYDPEKGLAMAYVKRFCGLKEFYKSMELGGK